MFLHGDAHFYARSVSYLGMTIWAYEEFSNGVNGSGISSALHTR